MATINLYSNRLNQMPEMIQSVRTSVSTFRADLMELNRQALMVEHVECDLDDVIQSIQASAQTLEARTETLISFQNNSSAFVEVAVDRDSEAADLVNQNKEDFYEKYDYLKPDSEKSDWEVFWEDAGEWCKEHWKEIVMTVVIVVGAVLAIAAVVCTGGAALAPMLAAALSALGVASGTAMTAATIISFVVAGIAITSTLASSTLNLIDLWGDMSGNSTFQAWKTAMNWTSAISNGFYSVGSMFNAAHGISNSALCDYSKQFLKSSEFRQAILGADNYTALGKNLANSEFWTALGKDGARISEQYAKDHGSNTLGMLLKEHGIPEPADYLGWRAPSAYMAMNASGDTSMLYQLTIKDISTWSSLERYLIGINPNITSLTITQLGGTVQFIPRVFQFTGFAGGLSTGFESFLSLIGITD